MSKHHSFRQTKIVATIGPATSEPAMIRKLIDAGVDVFRINFSHGTAEEKQARVATIRSVEEKIGRPIGIIGDLQGPKLRIGTFREGSIALRVGMVIRFDLDPAVGDETRVSLPHPEVIEALEKGDQFLLDDGRVRVLVEDKGADFVMGKIVSGRKLSNNKGLNVPGVVLPIEPLTGKDRKDLVTALDLGVDWIALSFVQKPEDLVRARKLIGGRAALMAKIEKPSALEHIDAIIALSDGIMLARGDLGVEIPPEDVPSVQKRIVRQVRHASKPIIVATQMLESMIDSPRPTRAEASDVATAVYDGADAVMLSAETAIGSYPVEAVSIMHRICTRTEDDDIYRRIMLEDQPESEGSDSDAITVSAYHVARKIQGVCITTYTISGSTTLRIARMRPRVPILCLTSRKGIARRLALSYGVRAVEVEPSESFADAVQESIMQAKAQGLARRGQRFVLTAGVPFNTQGMTNILRVVRVE